MSQHGQGVADAPRFHRLESAMAPLAIDNVDTDQIIPASYLKITSREGLREGLFAGWRRRQDGSPNEAFVLEDPRYRGAEILIAGDNFGCGSSREHAPWALLDFGIKAVISTRFADIFRSNALRNGLLTVVLPAEAHERLMTDAENNPGAQVTIDLESQTVIAPWGDELSFDVDPFARHCLLEGIDSLGYLLAQSPAIEIYEATRGPLFDTRHPHGFEVPDAAEVPS